MQRKIKTNLLQQNCYRLDVIPEVLKDAVCVDDSYINLQEVTERDGVKLVATKEKYPITPDYVNSFASCDYKNDVIAAASMPQKNNLGDMSAISLIQHMSAEELEEVRQTIINKYSVPVASPEQASVVKEDKDNG